MRLLCVPGSRLPATPSSFDLFTTTRSKTMWKCVTVVALAALAACSSSTSPSKSSSSGLTTPGGAAQGDSVDLTGTYQLTSYTADSADGNSSTIPANSTNGGTLVLTSTQFTLTWLGTFASDGNQSGTYMAVDTSASADQGTLTLTSTKTQNGTYLLASGTLTVTIPQSSGETDVTVWTKQ
jgi:hypothetical protein